MIRDLNPEDVEHLVSVSGMVTRCSAIIPEVRCGNHASGSCCLVLRFMHACAHILHLQCSL